MSLAQRQEYYDRTAALIDEEVQRIINERYAHVQLVLSDQSDALDCVARALLEHESLNEAELRRLVGVAEVSAAPLTVVRPVTATDEAKEHKP